GVALEQLDVVGGEGGVGDGLFQALDLGLGGEDGGLHPVQLALLFVRQLDAGGGGGDSGGGGGRRSRLIDRGLRAAAVVRVRWACGILGILPLGELGVELGPAAPDQRQQRRRQAVENVAVVRHQQD